ncbi:MAG: aminotransferase class IV [Candidatus Omnitrophota bacterium]
MDTVYFNGSWLPRESSKARALLNKLFSFRGAFETMRGCGGKVYLLERHLNRLTKGCVAAGVRPPDRSLLKKSLSSFLAAGETGLRLAVFSYQGKPAILVSSRQRPDEAAYAKGFTAVLLKPAGHPNSAGPHVKSLQRAFYTRLARQARQKGSDEALFLSKGLLVEGSRTNIFLIKDAKVFTPALSSGCLEGITRKRVLDLLKGAGLKPQEARLKKEDLFSSDEIFLTNALIGVMPLTRLCGKAVGRGRPGRLTLSVRKVYENDVEKTCAIL